MDINDAGSAPWSAGPMGHRTGSNRPAYFDELRSAFDRAVGHDIPSDVVDELTCDLRAEQNPERPRMPERTGNAAEPAYRPSQGHHTKDWHDGTNEGWGE